MHHFLHPAFQFNGEELGFWVANINQLWLMKLLHAVNSNIENCNNLNLNAKLHQMVKFGTILIIHIVF